MRRHGILAGTLAAMCMVWAGTALAAGSTMTPTTPTTAKSHAAKSATYRTVRGEVTAVQPDSVTLKESGKSNEIFKATLSNKTTVHEGKTKKSANDLKVGERIAVRYSYDSANQVNLANSIRILHEAPKA